MTPRYSQPAYRSWNSMRQRCNNEENEHYGARGITYCPEWADYDVFLADMGPRPEGTTLDRIDPDGDYCPENCRWAHAALQNRNKKNNPHFTVHGVTDTISGLIERFNLPITRKAASQRVHSAGWDIERALFTPMRKDKRRVACR